MIETEALADAVRNAPAAPGCYLYRDAAGRVIYVGKAKNLRNRVRSYFQESRPRDPKTALLVEEIRSVEYVVAGNELEAFLLESNLIHTHLPRFNLMLRDDKSFPFICLDVKSAFPRLTLVRRPTPDGSRLFGPFLSAGRARGLMDFVRVCFGVRTCRKIIDGKADRPCCIDYHINRCLAPCVARLCLPERYRESVAEAVLFLEGKNEELIGRLDDEMHQAAEALEFEHAALCRDRLAALRELGVRQRVIATGAGDMDVFGLARSGEAAAVHVFHVVGGGVCDRRQYFLESEPPSEPSAFWGEFLTRFYAVRELVPPVLVLSAEPEEGESLGEWLSAKRGGRVRFSVPQRGPRRRLLEWAEKDARQALLLKHPAAGAREALTSLRESLRLERDPEVVEAFDISTLQGRETVASLVCARGGELSRADYRHYRVRGSDGRTPDDFAAMREVVGRRYARLAAEGKPLPDLVLVDGGAGQVSSARAALAELGLEERLPLCGLAKREEEIHRPGGGEPLRLPRNSPALRFLQRIRDEAHRFAVAFHRKRRAKAARRSLLDGVPGLGPVGKKRLLEAFGSLAAIQAAEREDLAKVLSTRQAAAVFEHFHPPSPK